MGCLKGPYPLGLCDNDAPVIEKHTDECVKVVEETIFDSIEFEE